MRLLVSCIPFDGGKSGISTYVRETVAALAAQGHELTLLVEPDGGGGGGVQGAARSPAVGAPGTLCVRASPLHTPC